MVANVPEAALSKLPKQHVEQCAPRAACGIPCGKLVAVCSDVSWQSTEIYGLVRRQQFVNEEDELGVDITNLWLLRLVRALDGSYHWEDFIPDCEHCCERMRPVMSRKEQPACPVCKGRRGKGKCFQFECPRYSSQGSGSVQTGTRSVYCGSHPYFCGYEVTDECFGNSGHPLFRFEEHYDESNKFTLVAKQAATSLQVDIFRDGYGEASLRVHVEEQGKQSIMSPAKVRKCSGSSPVSSATVVGWNRELAEGKFRQYTYMFVQRSGLKSYILRSMETEPNQWLDSAIVEADEECGDFQNQVVAIHESFCRPARIAGLSDDGLWVMDVPNPSCAEGPKTARSMASKVSWQRVLKLTDLQETDTKMCGRGFPRRLLALGPKPNQVVIFAADDDSSEGVIRPRLLVEIPASLPAEAAGVKIAHLTSIDNVPIKSKEVGEKALSSHLLPSIIRVSGQCGGYLFFNKLGQVYHLRDEAVILAEAAWRAPDFKEGSIKHQLVLFKLKDAEERGHTRLCVSSALERYEYFQKLLGEWQEGASAEVTITDTDPDVFDQLLAYIHTGIVDCRLELVALVRLITLANKYLMHDLVASCLLRILGILEDKERMQRQEASALAETLAFSDNASTSCPTLLRKTIDAVLTHRGDVIKDQEFLTGLSNSSAKALSSLLAPLAPTHDQWECVGIRKRRKIVQDMNSSLWHKALDASEMPRWCLHV